MNICWDETFQAEAIKTDLVIPQTFLSETRQFTKAGSNDLNLDSNSDSNSDSDSNSEDDEVQVNY